MLIVFINNLGKPMTKNFIKDPITDQIFDTVCQRAANGHSDLYETAKTLLRIATEVLGYAVPHQDLKENTRRLK